MRYVVDVKAKKYSDIPGKEHRIKIIGKITFKSNGQKLLLNKKLCPSIILNGDYTKEEYLSSYQKVKDDTFGLAKKIMLEEKSYLTKELNKKARNNILESDSRFL